MKTYKRFFNTSEAFMLSSFATTQKFFEKNSC